MATTAHVPRSRFVVVALVVAIALAGVGLVAVATSSSTEVGDTAGSVTTAEVSTSTTVANGHDHMTMDDPPRPTRPLTASERTTLEAQLDAARRSLPGTTVAEAEAAGYETDGMSNHISNRSVPADHFDPARPPILLTGSDDDVVAFVYWVDTDPDDPPPAGFAGPQDQWHYHGPACRIDGKIVHREVYPTDQCLRDGGEVATAGGYMLHVWAVPGHHNPRGLFAPAD